MHDKIVLALDSAEKNYIYIKNIESSEQTVKYKDHIIALHALFESFIHYGFAVSQTPEVICELDEDSYLYASLIEPHLQVVDDVEMIARQYSSMYVKFIAKIAGGFESKKAVEDLFS